MNVATYFFFYRVEIVHIKINFSRQGLERIHLWNFIDISWDVF
jgi:hypothetical protein